MRGAYLATTAAAAVLAAALCATAAQATTVHEGKGILPTFDPKGAHTTDAFRDLDVKSATATYDADNVYLTATMFGDIGSTDTGFYVWGVNTGTGIDFFQQQKDHPEVGQGIKFDTFIILKPDGSGSVNYFSGEPSEGVSKVTISGATISAVISRDTLEDGATIDISKFGFNIWPRANGFGNVDITDFAPDHENFTASATPEPAAWALMIGGFGLAGTALRRRRTLRTA